MKKYHRVRHSIRKPQLQQIFGSFQLEARSPSDISDLGGSDVITAAERSIVRRAATLTVELERMEGAFASAGEATPEALDLYSRTAGNLRRLLESVGLQRRAKDITPDLRDYVSARSAEAE